MTGLQMLERDLRRTAPLDRWVPLFFLTPLNPATCLFFTVATIHLISMDSKHLDWTDPLISSFALRARAALW
jgi:hypothetical protein